MWFWFAVPACSLGAPLLALHGRWRRAIAWAAAFALAFAAIRSWFDAAAVVVAVALGALVDAVVVTVRLRRAPPPRRWGRAAAIYGAQGAAAVVVLVGILSAFHIPEGSMCPTIHAGDHVLVDRFAGAPARGDVIVFEAPGGGAFVSRAVAIAGDVVAIRGGVLQLDGRDVPTTRVGDARCLESDGGDELAVVEYDETIDGRTHRIARDPTRAAPATPLVGDFPPPMGGDRDAPCGAAGSVGTSPFAPSTLSDDAGWEPMTSAAGGCRVPAGAVFVLGDARDHAVDSRMWGAVSVGRVVGRVIGVWLPTDQPSREWSRFGAIR